MVPHTAAKHELLKTYLDRWFPILGLDFRGQPGRINYIDGFAGPGEYDRGEIGSPQIAIQSALAHVQSGNLLPNVEINFIFVESKPEFARNLAEKLSQLQVPSHFKVKVIQGEFADVVGSILDDIQARGGALAPTFAFVDPFGFSGIPFELMQRILSHRKCEVYINIMVEFINRFLQHPDEDVVAHFPRTFGTDEVLEIPLQAGDRVRAILELYKRQLSLPAKYVGRFDMHGRKDQHTYSLFFASNHPRGFQKMKEAHWKVDKANGGKFS
ncbi:MAG: three-Cys-motif partner protein TcmP [Planctomycetes bacterium]|nr:three-Cys-motif partner protein TcmP [Planctomycetota bacterium]